MGRVVRCPRPVVRLHCLPAVQSLAGCLALGALGFPSVDEESSRASSAFILKLSQVECLLVVFLLRAWAQPVHTVKKHLLLLNQRRIEWGVGGRVWSLGSNSGFTLMTVQINLSEILST